jgi:hypothetical protein
LSIFHFVSKFINIHFPYNNLDVYKIKFSFIFLLSSYAFPEGIAVYSDYLSDNYYLIHPSMAGAANCAKIRLTARKQWFGQADAPELQTISFNGRVSEKLVHYLIQ